MFWELKTGFQPIHIRNSGYEDVNCVADVLGLAWILLPAKQMSPWFASCQMLSVLSFRRLMLRKQGIAGALMPMARQKSSVHHHRARYPARPQVIQR